MQKDTSVPIVDDAAKTRATTMKWLKIGVDKDPVFDKIYFLYDKGGDFYTGILRGINITTDGKEYSFNIIGIGDPADNITHYAIPKQPV